MENQEQVSSCSLPLLSLRRPKQEARLLRASPLSALSPTVAVEARARRVSILATPPPYPRQV